MSKYIFLNMPGYGHVNPTLAVARELVARGEEVIYYLTEEFRSAIEATGATFRPYDSLMTQMRIPTNFSPTDAPGNGNTMLPIRMANEGLHVLPQIYESIRAERPDVIAYGMMCLWAKVVTRSLHVPAVQFKPTYALNEQMDMQHLRAGAGAGVPTPARPEFFKPVNEKLAELCHQYHVEPFTMQELFMGSEPLTIVFLPREFQPKSETFNGNYVFVGPSLTPRPDTTGFPIERLIGQKVLFISLGTIFNNQAEFFNTCFAAFKDRPWLVVLSRGKNVDPAQLDAVPENFLVAPYVPQLEVLKYASAFISHGGMNSTMESLYYGVPLVAVPQMVEQSMTAQRVAELGLGIALDKEHITVEGLRDAVDQVINEPAYKQRVLEMQKHIHDAGGYKRAADAMINYRRSFTPVAGV